VGCAGDQFCDVGIEVVIAVPAGGAVLTAVTLS
jgi:hypothetical protein